MLVRLVQLPNACSLMEVRELGKVTDVIFEPNTKPVGKETTPFPIVTRSIFEVSIQPLVVLDFTFQMRSVIPVQRMNEKSPMEVTELGMVRLVTPVQESNA